MLSLRSEERIRARKLDLRRGPTNTEDTRRRRADETIRLRQDKREEVLVKRRMGVTPETGAGAEPAEVVTKKLSELPNHIQDIFSDDPIVVEPALTALRKLLSLETRPPIQKCIDAGVVPRLVALLACNDYPMLQFEACWSLTNIASGSNEQTAVVVESGAVQALLPLMSCGDAEVRGQCVWALANISGDGPSCRDYVLRYGAMTPLLALLMAPNPSMRLQRDATWMLSNLCRGKDAPWDIIAPAIPVLSRLLYSADNDVLADACWALLFMVEADMSRTAKLLSDGIGPQLVSLLRHPSHAVQHPALRVVGNILFGDEEQTQAMLNMNVLVGLDSLIHSDQKRLRKEACWSLSNIAAGNTSQLQALMDYTPIMDTLMDFAQHAEYTTKIESLHTLANAFNGGSMDQVRRLVSMGAFDAISFNLDIADDKVLATILEAIERTFALGLKDPKIPANHYVNTFELNGGIDKLEDLHSHSDDEIWKAALKIMKTFWPDTNNDENASPNITMGGTYAWGE